MKDDGDFKLRVNWAFFLILLLSLFGCSKPKVDDAISASANFDINDYAPSNIVDGQFSNSKNESPIITFSPQETPEGVQIQTQVVKSNNSSLVKNWTTVKSGDRLSGLSLSEGAAYSLKLRAVKGESLFSNTVWSDGWIVDTLPPSQVGNLQDGTTSNSLVESPSITFTSASDGTNGSGVDKYYIQVLKSSDDTVVKSWTEFTSGAKVQNLNLVNSQSYKVQIKAVDKMGYESAVSTSDGWQVQVVIVDNTPPTPPTNIVDGSFSKSLDSSPTITFTSGTDLGSGIQRHQAQVLKVSDSSVVKDWFDLTTGSAISSLSLNSGQQYKIKMRAVDVNGNLSSEILSDGWIVDAEGPTTPVIVADGNYESSLTQSPVINFTASSDSGSGLQSHQVQIVKASDSSVVNDWTGFSSGSRVSGLSLVDGQNYLVKLRALDNLGNISAVANGDGWTVDVSPPTAPSSLSHGSVSNSLTSSPAVTFTLGVDTGSGLLKHQARVIKSSDSSVIKDWTDFTSGSSISGMTLVNGTSYIIQIKAIDNLNQVSSVATSSGWLVQQSSVTVNWNANKEKAVNSAGGGYKVYYSQTSGFSIGSASFVDVPYVSGSLAPTTASIAGLATGTWYIKIIAYSTINGSSLSAVSDETSVVVP